MAQDNNFIFGKSIAGKFNTTKQRFILEAMMFSLVFMIIGDIVGTFYTLFYTKLAIAPMIIIGISGFFGAIFMLMILISTYQSYNSYLGILSVQEELQKLIDDTPKELKGGENEKG